MGDDKSPKKKKEWVKLYADESDASTIPKLLRGAGLRVITLSIKAGRRPELRMGRERYRGREKIMEAIEALKTNP